MPTSFRFISYLITNTVDPLWQFLKTCLDPVSYESRRFTS